MDKIQLFVDGYFSVFRPKSKEGMLSCQPKMVEFGNAPELKSQVKVKISNSTAADQVVSLVSFHCAAMEWFCSSCRTFKKWQHFFKIILIKSTVYAGDNKYSLYKTSTVHDE